MRDYESLIEPVRGQRTFEEVSNKIKELIFNGVLKPGEKLPSEANLARLFNVGRQSVREALRVLEQSGFISVKTGVKGGPVIEDTVHRKIADLFLDAFKFNRVSQDDYAAALSAIETSMIDFVLANADAVDIKGLRDNIRAARERLDANEPAFAENIDFHRLFAKASKNYVFCIVIEAVLAVLSDFRSKFTPVAGVEPSRRITELHEQELEAIIAKDKRIIVDAIEEDLAAALRILASKPQ